MSTHTKPTPEELEANIQKAQEELEALKPEAEKPVELPSETESQEVKTEVTEEQPPKEETTEKKEETTKPQEEVDEVAELRKKQANSTRENQIIYAQNKKMAEAFDKATQVTEPTEEELKIAYPGWEEMSDFEKTMGKETLINKRRFKAIEEASQDFKNLEAWSGKVTEFIENPENLTKYPSLEGKEAEFKLYAMKPTRRGVDFEDLVSGFLYTAETNKPKNKGKMFETGTGGSNEKPKPKSNKISVDAAAQLRKTNYPLYKQYLTSGRIESVE